MLLIIENVQIAYERCKIILCMTLLLGAVIGAVIFDFSCGCQDNSFKDIHTASNDCNDNQQSSNCAFQAKPSIRNLTASTAVPKSVFVVDYS